MVKLVLISLILFGCSNTATSVYYDTWRPTLESQYSHNARLVTAALLLQSPEDLQTLTAAGGMHIGWHEKGGGLALRSGSTGGTHFYPVAETTNNYAACFVNQFVFCTAWTSTRWSRVAVFRIEPEKWHLLPQHLIPTEKDLISGVPYSAIRRGCITHKSRGISLCQEDWTTVYMVKKY